MSDTKKICCECHGKFVFSAAEQARVAAKGHTAPRRCRACRAERRDNRLSAERLARKKEKETEVHCCPLCGEEFLLSLKRKVGVLRYCPRHF